MVLNNRIPPNISLVSHTYRKRRLLWTKEPKNWLLEDFETVAWSKESRLVLNHADGKIRIWRKQHALVAGEPVYSIKLTVINNKIFKQHSVKQSCMV